MTDAAVGTFAELHGLPENPYNPHALLVGDPEIGEGTWIGAFTVIDGSGGLRIGAGCDVSSGVHIYTHNTVRRCVSGRTYPHVDRAPTTIGDRVFLGANAVVLMGVTIGDEAVVAAGAVVTRDVPPRTVVAGVPARVVGTSPVDTLPNMNRATMTTEVENETELERLARVSQVYRPAGFEAMMVRSSGERVVARSQGTRCLEIGSALGGATELLADKFERLVVVEPAQAYAEAVRALGRPNIDVAPVLIEDFESDEKFDTVVIAHVLEHVLDPVDALRRCAAVLADGGVIIAVVPNGGSLHRRLGVSLGMLEKRTDFSDADLSVGHRRVYEPDTLRADVEAGGLTVTDTAGHFCKPLSSGQIDALPDEVQRGLIALGDELPPEFGSEILLVCRK